jgi:hypothetical protein
MMRITRETVADQLAAYKSRPEPMLPSTNLGLTPLPRYLPHPARHPKESMAPRRLRLSLVQYFINPLTTPFALRRPVGPSRRVVRRHLEEQDAQGSFVLVS